MKNYLKLMLLLICATLLFQGFQCASREMTTAKVALQRGDTEKAIENLKLEIDKNPKNAEAYILLAELKSKEGEFEEAAALMDKAEPLCANDPKLRDRPANFKFTIFKDAIDKGQENFNRWLSNKTNTRQFERAVSNFTTATKLRPHYAEAYRMIATAFELAENTDSALIFYVMYVETIQASIDIAISRGLYIGAEESAIDGKLGTRKFIRGSKMSDGDSTILDHFSINGKDLYVQLVAKQNGDKYDMPVVQSWFYDPPQNILPAEREIVPASFSPSLASMATLYYNKKDYDNSIKYFKLLAAIEPSNPNANSAIIALYQEMNKPEEAAKAINENIQRFPDNPLFVAQLGDIYMNREEYDKAIQEYEKAIKIKPDFDAALRNIASCYGNKAAIIQKAQLELVNAKVQKDVDVKAYEDILLKAIEYFEKTLKTEKFKDDPVILGDLCAAYIAMPSKKADFDKTLKQLESLENSVPKEKKEAYLMTLYRIYSATANPKMSEIEDKINSLE
ncbi:MAG: tetratricopeptide repeat protein [Bacteroidetes bacterium]|nr:tetratricopeptide repeat protein [Bacteroidota bacterium]